jgi:hypothetical protein
MCPLCEKYQEDDDCAFITVKKTIDGKEILCCCDNQVKKVKSE